MKAGRSGTHSTRRRIRVNLQKNCEQGGDLVEEVLSMRSNKKGTRSSDMKENVMVLRVEVLARGGAGGETEVGFDLDVDE